MSETKQYLIIEYRNRLFLDKRCRYPWQSFTRAKTLGVGVWLLLAVGLGFALKSTFEVFYTHIDSNMPIPSHSNGFWGDFALVILFLGGMLLSLFFMRILFKDVKKFRKLQRHGKMVNGIVLEAISITNTYRNSPVRTYDVKIRVVFRAPDSSIEIEGEHQYTTVHKPSASLLESNTPVYIMYLDENTWEVL